MRPRASARPCVLQSDGLHHLNAHDMKTIHRLRRVLAHNCTVDEDRQPVRTQIHCKSAISQTSVEAVNGWWGDSGRAASRSTPAWISAQIALYGAWDLDPSPFPSPLVILNNA